MGIIYDISIAKKVWMNMRDVSFYGCDHVCASGYALLPFPVIMSSRKILSVFGLRFIVGRNEDANEWVCLSFHSFSRSVSSRFLWVDKTMWVCLYNPWTKIWPKHFVRLKSMSVSEPSVIHFGSSHAVAGWYGCKVFSNLAAAVQRFD